MGWINDSDDPNDPDSITYYGGGSRWTVAEKAAAEAHACAARFAAAEALVAPPKVSFNIEVAAIGVSWLRVPYYRGRRGRGPLIENDRRTLKGLVVKVDGRIMGASTLSEGEGTLTCRKGALEVEDGFSRYSADRISVVETVLERRTVSLRRKACVCADRVPTTEDIEEDAYIHLYSSVSEALGGSDPWGMVGGLEPLWHLRYRAYRLVREKMGR